jgi:hypothetical protein
MKIRGYPGDVTFCRHGAMMSYISAAHLWSTWCEEADCPDFPPNRWPARSPISKSTRFDVFHRDGFACRYCGARAPDAVLVVDHVVAVANGGASTIHNLVTACEPCNAGKAAKVLV